MGSPYGGQPHVSAETFYRAAVTLREQIASRSVHDVQKDVVPVLAQALQAASTAQERLDLVKALATLGPAARTALPVLTDRLKNSQDPLEVAEVLRTLKAIGPAARDALPMLVALSDRCDTTRRGSHPGRSRPTYSKLVLSAQTGNSVARFTPVEGQQVLQTLAKARLEGPEGRCGIDDRAGCFSVKALRRSTRFIRALAQRKHVEVLFETVQLAPELGKNHPKVGTYADRLKAMGAAPSTSSSRQRGTPSRSVSARHALRRDGITPEKLLQEAA